MKLIALLIVVFFVLVAIKHEMSEKTHVQKQFDCPCLYNGMSCGDCHTAIAQKNVNFYCRKCNKPKVIDDAALLRAAK